ncbi:membrane protein insertion efficiency factor YidD [Blattabacterium cuenoti]|uniref:membrane protein insertion efficiency factor YidD n=1 Tax=Blattabacterium cuenoti TaxID=1653831 RepID=UPI00163C5E29|nr:membrane protein insertion efficiency factor YidD [Blattabacterium cuenoti]
MKNYAKNFFNIKIILHENSKYFFIESVRLYQKGISPWIGNNCRFTPTCSEYMIGSLKKWPFFKGFFIGIKRIISCHPWGPSGYDPI